MVYENFFANSHCSFLICKNDPYSTVLYSNDYFYNLIGYTRDEFESLFENKFSLLVIDDLSQILAKVKVAAEMTQMLDYEFRIKHKKGHSIWIHDIATFVPEDDVFYVTLMDISYKTIALEQQRKLHQLTEVANKSKETFLAQISHNLRSPLNGIIGTSHLAKRALDDSSKLEKYLEQLTTSSNHLKSLIDSFLRVFEINADLTTVNHSPFSLNHLIEEIELIVEPNIMEKKQTFKINNQIVMDNVISDELLVKEIILNLIYNAIKYTDIAGEITLTLMPGDVVAPQIYDYHICVTDTGCGISKDELKQIETDFFRSSEAKEISPEGNGFGLSIVKNYLHHLNGTLTIESEVNVGSTFTVKMPFQRCSVAVPSKSLKEMFVDSTKKHDLNILIADDNEINIEILKTLLEEHSHDVTVATNGRQVVDIFNNSPIGHYDCIFMDLNMPKINGYEASILIRNATRDDANIPIFAVSAHVFPEQINKAKAIGIDVYLTKPINFSIIENHLQHLINEKR